MQRRKSSERAAHTQRQSFYKKTLIGRLADLLTTFFGTIGFLVANAFFFLGWILINTGNVPGVAVFDPFPFNLLTMCVSLEAIVLSVIVLISQNNAANVADVREEIDFRINVEAEREITKILKILGSMEHHLHMRVRRDKELNKMKRPLNIERIAAEVMKERLGR